MSEVPPNCVYCASVGVEESAVMGFEMPVQTVDMDYGYVFVALCNRHFEELRNTLNAVYDSAHPSNPLIIRSNLPLN